MVTNLGSKLTKYIDMSNVRYNTTYLTLKRQRIPKIAGTRNVLLKRDRIIKDKYNRLG